MTAPNKPASKKKLDLKVKRVQKLKTNIRGGKVLAWSKVAPNTSTPGSYGSQPLTFG
jgi:hypothetical protein